MKRFKYTFFLCIAFCAGILFSFSVYKLHRQHQYEQKLDANYPPYNTAVSIDSTNLPIVFIDTRQSRIERESYGTAHMRIIDNGNGQLNYADTVRHNSQTVDYDGTIAIRYRGTSSYNCLEKKSYAIRPMCEGKKTKASLLGMTEGKKWALQAVLSDRSLIRDVLTYELARPYFEFVPQARHCEVIVDGIYYGVYILLEQITRGRLPIKKTGDSGNKLTGGYLLQIETYMPPKERFAHDSKYWEVRYCYESPDESISEAQKTYIDGKIDAMEDAFMEMDFPKIKQHVDFLSFADYQLVTELSHNMDGYVRSTYIYKYRDKVDTRFKTTLWDYDLGYGNSNYGEGWRNDTWRAYDDLERVQKQGLTDRRPFLWGRLMESQEYMDVLRGRWAQYRRGNYSDEHIEATIDSLTNLLTAYGAVQRNSQAWAVWSAEGQSPKAPRYIWPNKYVSSSYQDEISYLKRWLYERLQWMDGELLGY